jgi:UDP-N-acetylglucosamine diphosphorylase/glucosamine-1-phosphate N-acetyltransferase
MTNDMIVFDDHADTFGPLTDLRSVFELRTGMYTTAMRLALHRRDTLAGYWVPPHLRDLVQQRAPVPVNRLPETADVLCVNGRWALPDRPIKLKTHEALVEEESGDVIAVRLPHADALPFLETGDLPDSVHRDTLPAQTLYRYPWQIVDRLKQTIAHDIHAMPALDSLVPSLDLAIIGDHPVTVHAAARVYPDVTFDAEHGPIFVHAEAVLRPGVILCGPCAIGPGSTVLDRTLIKAHTAIGPRCKVAGEIGATVFQGYSNKAHDGHLGDSYIGKWVNLGAGTTNSNLLNTYSDVSMLLDVGGHRQRTGMTFLGSIIGDHVKTAICTRLMTGTVLGTGAMIATTAAPPTTVKRFAWLTDAGERVFRYNKFVDVMKTIMARRDCEPGDAYLARLREVYDAATGGDV